MAHQGARPVRRGADGKGSGTRDLAGGPPYYYQLNTPGYIRGTTKNRQFPANTNDQGAYRHNGGATYIFVDGHAKWHRPEQIPCSVEKCWWAVENRH
jgi:prepilin-type processing-associated H-X9-DG protein